MTPLKVNDATAPDGERLSRTKVTGFLMALIGTWRLAESMFAFHLLPEGVEAKIGPFVDLAFTVGGFFVIVFRGNKG